MHLLACERKWFVTHAQLCRTDWHRTCPVHRKTVQCALCRCSATSFQAGYSSTAKRQVDEGSRFGKGKAQVDPGHVEVHPDKIDKAMSER